MISNRGYRALARLVQRFLDRVERIFQGWGERGEERRDAQVYSVVYNVYVRSVRALNCVVNFPPRCKSPHVCLMGSARGLRPADFLLPSRPLLIHFRRNYRRALDQSPIAPSVYRIPRLFSRIRETSSRALSN